ncbi:MAG: serine kinase [Bacteroidales bacterium]|nr:serine kinase [Bacteroidales bacterium]
MTISELIQLTGFKIWHKQDIDTREIAGFYASDLLSDVFSSAQENTGWITVQTHPNVIAVAVARHLSCIIFSKGLSPEEKTLQWAIDKGITLLGSDESTFEICAKITRIIDNAK